jgi:translation initiation factor 2-alpha kinase 4
MNKIDECLYAVKIINLKGVKGSNQIMKEVLVLSRLQHKNIVRYHNAWFEENSDDEEEGSGDEDESSFDSEESSENSEWVFAFQRSRGSIEPFFEKDTQNKGCKLYIQMEYCAGNTLQEVLNNGLPSHEDAWKMLKEILNALVYVHSRKTIHRDLKPSNIFLGGDGEVKLGDFGLAATSENKEKQDYAVGTPLYFSPEQEQGKYDQKSDMFALGIIFFEMWRSFGSYMQKATEIKTLGKKHLLPEDFDVPNEVKDIIIWLTHPEPEQRPTAEQVLLSSYLPHQIDKKTFEEFLRVATRPNTVENEWLYQEVFKQENQAHIEFTYNTTSAINEVPTISRRKIKVDSMIKTAVSLKLQEVFTNAGAVDIKTPLLYPYFKHFAISVQDRTGKFTQVMVENDPNASILIERSGIIVQLPDNSVVPWARKIAKKELGGIIKRFNMQIVYKTSGNREHPKEIKQARLDYCYETVYYNKNLKFWLQAEMLAITMQAIKEVLGETTEVQGGMIEVHVNDSRVIDAMMDYLEIRMNLRAKVLKVFANMYRLRSPVIKKKLAELGLSFSIIEKLEYYFKLSGKLTKVKGYLEKQPIFRDKVLQQVMNEDLSLLEKYCDYFGLNVVFNLSVVNEDLLYYSGFLCRIVYKDYVVNTKSNKKETIILAAGGCYDNLINHYSIHSKSRSKNKNKTQNSSTSGLGITIYYEHIISILLQSGNYSWLHGSTVFLTSKVQFDDGELYSISRKKIEHTVELWKSGISVIYNYNDMPTEDIIDMCRRYKIRICVFYEEKAKREQERVECEKKDSEKTGPDRKDSEGDGKADMKITIRDFSSKQKVIEEVKKEEFVKRIKERSALPVNKLNYPLKHNEKKDIPPEGY